MIAINKYEKEAILEKFPDAQIVRTMKHDSKRHHYYAVEDRRIVRLVNEMRGITTDKKPQRRKK